MFKFAFFSVIALSLMSSGAFAQEKSVEEIPEAPAAKKADTKEAIEGRKAGSPVSIDARAKADSDFTKELKSESAKDPVLGKIMDRLQEHLGNRPLTQEHLNSVKTVLGAAKFTGNSVINPSNEDHQKTIATLAYLGQGELVSSELTANKEFQTKEPGLYHDYFVAFIDAVKAEKGGGKSVVEQGMTQKFFKGYDKPALQMFVEAWKQYDALLREHRAENPPGRETFIKAMVRAGIEESEARTLWDEGCLGKAA